jgi:hypothetical protein
MPLLRLPLDHVHAALYRPHGGGFHIRAAVGTPAQQHSISAVSMLRPAPARNHKASGRRLSGETCLHCVRVLHKVKEEGLPYIMRRASGGRASAGMHHPSWGGKQPPL